MIHYYINPKTNDLIAYDDESKAITELERVGELFQAKEKEEIAPVRKKQSPAEKPVPIANKNPYKYTQKKERTCSNCLKPGHRADRCPESGNAPKAKEKDRPGIDEATIKKIRELHDSGKTIGEIKADTGSSYATIYRYRTYKPEPYEPEEKDDGLDDETDDEPPAFGGSSREDGEDEDY
jgi:hypothetical protein